MRPIPEVPLDGVPVINISCLFAPNPDPEALKVTAHSINSACRDWGFFYVVEHGISPAFLSKFKYVSREFFGKSKEFKRSVQRNKLYVRGHADAGVCNLSVDWHEVFDFQSDKDTHENVLGRDKWCNQWPEGMTKFRDVLNEFYEDSLLICSKLLTTLFSSLNVSGEEAAGFLAGTRDTTFARVAYYKTCTEPDENFGINSHTDVGAFNLVFQDDDVSSLQVWKDGKCYDVPAVPNSLVVSIGDMVQVWTNDLYKAPVLQVVSKKINERTNFVFAYYPASGCEVKPLASCVSNENEPKYKPFTFGEWRAQRLLGDIAEVGDEPRIEVYRI